MSKAIDKRYNPGNVEGLSPFRPDFSKPAQEGTIRAEAPELVKYIAKRYPFLAIKHLEGNPIDGQFGVMLCEGQRSNHSYEFYSEGSPIGVYRFKVDLLDGVVEGKEFEFHTRKNVRPEDRGRKLTGSSISQ